MEGKTLPEVLLADQSGHPQAPDLDWLTQLARLALSKVSLRQRDDSVLPRLTEIEITLVDDPTIARVHADFMNLGDPTDVITFHHGEILISVDTAARQAPDYQRALRDEVALYLIHGLLHLAGYRDKSPAEFDHMAQTQEDVLQDCLHET